MEEVPLFAMPWVSVEVPPPDVGGMVARHWIGAIKLPA